MTKTLSPFLTLRLITQHTLYNIFIWSSSVSLQSAGNKAAFCEWSLVEENCYPGADRKPGEEQGAKGRSAHPPAHCTDLPLPPRPASEWKNLGHVSDQSPKASTALSFPVSLPVYGRLTAKNFPDFLVSL